MARTILPSWAARRSGTPAGAARAPNLWRMTSMTRGPLAPGVYWRRRLAVLGTALLLVVGVARMLGGGGDPDPKATNVSAPTSSTAPASPTTSVTPLTTPSTAVAPPPTTPATTAPPPTPTLPAPTGRCSDDDIVVTPSVADAQATKPVVVRLTLRTMVTTACTWRASAKTLQLKITSGSDRVWSTIDCPRAIPAGDVVVRRDTDAVVDVAWSSRRSDAECSKHTQWAMPGYYHVAVAALGGEPQDIQFALRKPRPTPPRTPASTPPAGTPTAGATATGAPTTGARQEPQTDPQKKAKKKRPGPVD